METYLMEISMSRQNPVYPASCPVGFQGRYVVSPGDTLFTLAQIFRVRLDVLARNNPHITDPNVLIPGDILCVPAMMYLPCCVQLIKRGRVPFGSGAVGFVNFGPRGGQSVSVLATLPDPAYFGSEFDMYIATVFIRDIGGFGNELFPTREDPPTWSTRIDLPAALSLTADARLVIQPSNSVTGIDGNVIFDSSLMACR